ncbi:hypothetical protein FRC00_013665 [Tulasnella sp. 408]|nr:hypothetical protein FRC00_013665 [Tulasnella sp. 408]
MPLLLRLPPSSGTHVLDRLGGNPFAEDVEKGTFYLKDDVLKLLRRFRRLEGQPSWTVAALQTELVTKQKERRIAVAQVQSWCAGEVSRQRKAFNTQRINYSRRISGRLVSRWGWSPVPYEELPHGRLKKVVDYLIGLQDLTNDAWKSVRGALTMAIRGRGAPDDRQRPFSLGGPGSSSK